MTMTIAPTNQTILFISLSLPVVGMNGGANERFRA